MYCHIGWVLLAMLAFSKLCNAGSTSPIWVSSTIFKCGAVTFTYSTTSTTSETMTVTYSSSMTNSTLKNPVLGITDLQYMITSFTISLSVLYTARSATSLTFRVVVNANSNLKSLKITYLAIDNAFAPPVSLNYYSPAPNISKGQSFTGYVNFTASTGVTLNMTHQNVLLPFINYLQIESNNGQVDIDLNLSLANGSFFQLIISTQANMTLKKIAVSRMLFDKTAIQEMGNDYFDYGIAIGSNNVNILTTIPPDILPSNLFFGLHSFTISTGISQINYKSNYNISTGSIGLYPQTGFTYTDMKFSYFHHKSRMCPDSYPYYNITEKLCYDICSNIYWYSDNSAMQCTGCLYDCFTCTNSTKCATCNTNISYRQLNGSSRCIPMAGYYDDGTSNVAKPCVGTCATCVSPGTSCLSCVSGSYVSGTNCINCSTTISNCATCTSGTACTACKSTFIFYSATNCSCNSSQYVASGQCNLCSSAITRCTSCSSATNCTACSSPFSLINATNCNCLTTQYLNSSNLCRLCSLDIANCNSCSSATNCTSCTSPFSLISPTNCSCSTSQYQSNGTCYSCSSAINRCDSCTNASYCTACSATFTLVSVTNCSCTSTQYLSSNQCYQCSSAISYCNTCSTATNCTACASSFTLYSSTNCSCNTTSYISSGTCNLCSNALSNCVSCTTATTCTTCSSTFTLSAGTCSCTSLQFLNTTSNQCVLCTQVTQYCKTCNSTTCKSCSTSFVLQNNSCVCPSGKYFNSGSSSCQLCSVIPHCLTCSSSSVCTTCDANYELNSTTFQCDYAASPCDVANCSSCVVNDSSKCLACVSGYSANDNATCDNYCGNWALGSDQECDDGNLIDTDGCSASCKIQSGFTCYPQVINSTNSYSKCYYSGKISTKKLWIRKIQGQNTIKCLFQLQQKIYQYRFMNFTNLVDIQYNETSSRLLATSSAIQSYSASYDAETNRYWVMIYYLTGLQNKNLVFSFNPYKDNSTTFSPPPGSSFVGQQYSSSVTVIPDNNQQADFYTDQEYGLYSVSVLLTYSLLGLGVAGLILAILFRTGTLIVIELITIMQITYFSLTFLDSMNPVYSGLLPFRYLAGLLTFKNIQAYLQQSNSPTSMKGSYMFLNLSENMGWATLCICCSVALGALLAIVYKIYVKNADPQQLQDQDIPHEEKKGEKIRRFAFYFIGELSLSFFFLFLPVYTLSLLFEILYTLGEFNIWSYAYAGGFFIGLVIFFIALIKTRSKVKRVSSFSKMGEFVSEFTCEKGFKNFKYCNWQMLQIILMAGLVMITIYSDSKLFSPLCFMLLAIIDIIIVAIVKPYRFGFASCCKNQRNHGQKLFEKIQMMQENPKKQEGDILQPDFANEWDQFKKNLKNMQERISSGKTTQAGLDTQVKNFKRPTFLNNNTRRIINLVSLILIEVVFIFTRIFNDAITKSYGGLSIQNSLPLFVHMILIINTVYNYFMLILQIIAKKRKQSVKLHNEEGLQEIADNKDYSPEHSKEKMQFQTMEPQSKMLSQNSQYISNASTYQSKNLVVYDQNDQNIFEQRPRKLKRQKASRKKRRNISNQILEQ